MTKASIGKGIVALSIMCAYIFLFGISGTISGDDSRFVSSEVNGTTSADTTSPEQTQTPAQTTDEIRIGNIVTVDAQNDDKPSFNDYSSRSQYVPGANSESHIVTESGTTNDGDVLIVDDTTAKPAQTTAPTNTETPGSTSAQTTVPQTDTNSDNTSSTADKPATSDDSDGSSDGNESGGKNDEALNEILYVDTYNLGEISGTALEIVASAVQGEIGGLFSEEAIKAQAVAAYTYIKKHNLAGDAPIIANPTPSARVLRIVEEVIGEAVYYKGELINSVYYSSSAGYSASSYEVWGVDYPYLQSTENKLDEEYDPNWDVKTKWTSDELKALAKSELGIELTGDPADWFEITGYVDNVYVGTMKIGGQSTYNDGTRDRIITGRTFREVMMNFQIKSHCFKIKYDADKDRFTITTRGYGHGVGFCQYGANTFASVNGWDYKQILQFYFIGCEIY